jgi:hypothetical protein
MVFFVLLIENQFIFQIAQMVASILFWFAFFGEPKKILQTSWKMVDRNAKTVASNDY